MLDENGKINLNLADVALLSAFLKALGEDEAQARQLAGAIVDWRDEDSLLQPGGGAEAPDYAAAGLPYGPATSVSRRWASCSGYSACAARCTRPCCRT